MSAPWQLSDTIRRAQGYLMGTAALTASWYGAATTTAPSRQTAFVALGLAAVGLVGAVECLWLLAGLRAVRDRRCSLQQGLSTLRPPVASATSARVSVPGGNLSHDPRCPAVKGKKQSAARRAGLRPCPLCAGP